MDGSKKSPSGSEKWPYILATGGGRDPARPPGTSCAPPDPRLARRCSRAVKCAPLPRPSPSLPSTSRALSTAIGRCGPRGRLGGGRLTARDK
jgi:hypothetical protein